MTDGVLTLKLLLADRMVIQDLPEGKLLLILMAVKAHMEVEPFQVKIHQKLTDQAHMQ